MGKTLKVERDGLVKSGLCKTKTAAIMILVEKYGLSRGTIDNYIWVSEHANDKTLSKV